VQIAIGRILGLAERPSEREARTLAEGWRPHRSAMAIMAWHHYNSKVL
jgi:DNA-3-methyladenine glycosylase II